MTIIHLFKQKDCGLSVLNDIINKQMMGACIYVKVVAKQPFVGVY